MDIRLFVKCLLIDAKLFDIHRSHANYPGYSQLAKIVGDSSIIALELQKKDINGAVGESKRASGSSHGNT
jgi:hypothetical protein